MSSPVHEIKGQHARFVLPVTLSAQVMRDLLLRTGVNPDPQQTFTVTDLTELSTQARAELVAVTEKAHVHWEADGEETMHGTPWWECLTEARCDGYLYLHRGIHDRWSRYLPDTEGNSVELDRVFFSGSSGTVAAPEAFAEIVDADEQQVLHFMLAGAPLVKDIGESESLELAHVLAAYEAALGLAGRLIALTDTGIMARGGFLGEPYVVTDDAVFLYPDLTSPTPNRPAAVLKSASPKAYEKAVELLTRLDSVIHRQTVKEKIDRVCFHWWAKHTEGRSDEEKVDTLLDMAVVNTLSDIAGETKKATEAEHYDECRAKWIAKHGSSRLKRAAERGYRHDGIYRDERLKVELPEFVGSLGRKPTFRELVNPSEAALEIEAEVLARAEGLGISDDQVRLVFAQLSFDTEWVDGEFVQIEGYLGRHTVWQSVSGEIDTDKIPF